MFLINHGNLRSPDGPTGSGGAPAQAAPAPTPAPAAAPSGQSGGQAPPAPGGQPAPTQPAGRFVSDADLQRYTRAEQQAAASAANFAKFKDRGFNDYESALTALDQHQRLNSDPTIKGIIDALAVKPNAPAQQLGSIPPAIDPASLDTHVAALVTKSLQAHEQARVEQEHKSGAARETELLNDSVKIPQLQTMFNGKSFDEAYEGKAGPAAKAVATLLDAEFVALAPRYSNGSPRPVTDPAIMRQAQQNVLQLLGTLKAHTLMEASTDQSALGAPSGNRQPPADGQQPDDSAFKFPSREQAHSDFMEAFRTFSAEGAGLPASQAV